MPLSPFTFRHPSFSFDERITEVSCSNFSMHFSYRRCRSAGPPSVRLTCRLSHISVSRVTPASESSPRSNWCWKEFRSTLSA